MSRLRAVFRLIPASALLRAERVYGSALKRLADRPLGHRAVEAAHKGAARALGKLAHKTRLVEGEDAVSASEMTMEKFFAPIMRGAEHDAGGDWSFEFTRCPYGLTASSQAPLCHAIMRLEEGLVRELGGELVIEQRIAEGAPVCRFRVKRS